MVKLSHFWGKVTKLDCYITPTSDHEAKFHCYWPREFGNFALKKRKTEKDSSKT